MIAKSTYHMGVKQAHRKKLGHTMPKEPLVNLNCPGRLWVANLLYLLGISHSSLYAGLKLRPGETTTRYPRPDGWDRGRPYWKTSTIKAFLDA